MEEGQEQNPVSLQGEGGGLEGAGRMGNRRTGGRRRTRFAAKGEACRGMAIGGVGEQWAGVEVEDVAGERGPGTWAGRVNRRRSMISRIKKVQVQDQSINESS